VTATAASVVSTDRLSQRRCPTSRFAATRQCQRVTDLTSDTALGCPLCPAANGPGQGSVPARLVGGLEATPHAYASTPTADTNELGLRRYCTDADRDFFKVSDCHRQAGWIWHARGQRFEPA